MTETDDSVSEAVLKDALRKSGGVGFWSWDIQNDVAQADAVSALLFNIAPARSKVGVPLSVLLEAIHPEDRHRLSTLILSRVQVGGSYSTEYRVVSLGGITQWIFTRGHFFLDGNGNPAHGRGVIVEITDTRTDVSAYVNYDEGDIEDPLNRAADLCLAAFDEISKIGDGSLLALIEVLLIDLARMIASQQKFAGTRNLH